MLIFDFDLCVYQKNSCCTLSAIGIDDAGACRSAIVIDLPEEELCFYKEEPLERLNSYDYPGE